MQCDVQATTPDGPDVCVKKCKTSMSPLIIMTVHIPCDAFLSVHLHAAAPCPFAVTVNALTNALGRAWRTSVHLLRCAQTSLRLLVHS